MGERGDAEADCLSRLKTYEQQLAQVQGALATDADNEELSNLEAELKNLIALTRQLISQGQQSQPSSSSGRVSGNAPDPEKTPSATPNPLPELKRFSAGDECQAKYAVRWLRDRVEDGSHADVHNPQGDGRWYAARIVSVGGSSSDPKYTVLYKGYDSTEIATSESLRPLKNAAGGAPTPTTASKRTASVAAKLTPEEEQERERKRKRSEKKAERSANRSAEANSMQNNWQKFAKKAEKKGALKSDKSMFKTPDDPLAKGEEEVGRWTGCLNASINNVTFPLSSGRRGGGEGNDAVWRPQEACL